MSSRLPAHPGQARTWTQDSQNPSCPHTPPPALPGPSPSSVLILPPAWKGTCQNLSPGQGPAVTLPVAGTLVCSIQCQPAGWARDTHTASDTSEVGRGPSVFYPKQAPSSRQAASPACPLSFCQAKHLPHTGRSEQVQSRLRAALARELPALDGISGAWDARRLGHTWWRSQVPAGGTPGEAPLQGLEHRPVFT